VLKINCENSKQEHNQAKSIKESLFLIYAKYVAFLKIDKSFSIKLSSEIS